MPKKRIPLTARQVRLLFERQDGKCAVTGCGTVLLIGPKGQRTNFVDEHLHALGRGGGNALKNRALYCTDCAKAKTFHPRSLASTIGSDIHEIRKTERMRKKASTITKPSGKWSKRKRAWPKRKFGT